jgi:kynureninase
MLTVLTPSDPAQRGCQLSLLFKCDVRALNQHLEAQGVVCDIREPHVIRAAPVPLYNTYADVWTFVDRLVAALERL